MGALARVHHGLPKLPRGRSCLTEDAVRAAHRERLLRAVIAAVAPKGYPAVTVADIVSGARVSRQVFYEHFADKEECFLEAYEQMTAAFIKASLDAAGEARIAQSLRDYGLPV